MGSTPVEKRAIISLSFERRKKASITPRSVAMDSAKRIRVGKSRIISFPSSKRVTPALKRGSRTGRSLPRSKRPHNAARESRKGCTIS